MPTNDPDKVIKGSEFTTEFTAIQTAFGLAAPAASPTFTGTVTIASVDINGGTIDGVTIATSDVTVGAGKTLDVSAGTLTLANDQISGDKIEGGTIGSVTITTADINGGTLDGVTIGGSSAGAITGTTGQFNTSLNVDGTVTADGLTVDGDGTLQTSDGPILNLKSTDATLESGNVVGSITFETSDSSSAGVAAKIEALGENAVGGVGLNFSSGFGGSPVKRMTIDRNGDISFYEDTGTTAKFFWDASAEALGIGTTSPAYDLDVVDASETIIGVRASNSSGTNVAIRFQDGGTGTGTNGLYVGRTSGINWFYSYEADPIVLGTNANERMRIDVSGNLLVGTTSQLNSGKISSIAVGANAGAFRNNSGAGIATLYVQNLATSGTRNFVEFVTSTTTVGTISTNGTTTSYNTSSDARLKENIADAEDAGAKVDAIQVRQFDWKVDGSHQDYGMVAQELLTVAPEAVSGDPESDDMMGVDYSKLVPMLVKEIQSLRARVAQLEGA